MYDQPTSELRPSGKHGRANPKTKGSVNDCDAGSIEMPRCSVQSLRRVSPRTEQDDSTTGTCSIAAAFRHPCHNVLLLNVPSKITPKTLNPKLKTRAGQVAFANICGQEPEMFTGFQGLRSPNGRQNVRQKLPKDFTFRGCRACPVTFPRFCHGAQHVPRQPRRELRQVAAWHGPECPPHPPQNASCLWADGNCLWKNFGEVVRTSMTQLS